MLTPEVIPESVIAAYRPVLGDAKVYGLLRREDLTQGLLSQMQERYEAGGLRVEVCSLAQFTAWLSANGFVVDGDL